MFDNRLSLPHLRSDIEWAVYCFSDSTYQKRHWIDLEPEVGVGVDSFDESFHTLFDDREGLAENPHSTIGDFLINKAEADAMAALISPLSQLLKKYGPLMTASVAMTDPLWFSVLKQAKILREIFERSAFTPPTD